MALALLAFIGPLAQAAPIEIQITGGYAVRTANGLPFGGGMPEPVLFAIYGDNFQLAANGSATPFGPCNPGNCTPGAFVMRDEFSTEDRGLRGQLVWNGSTVDWSGLPGSLNTVDIFMTLTGQFPALGAIPPQSVTFTSPFKASGGIVLPNRADPDHLIELRYTGRGVATITADLAPGSTIPSYALREVRYDFLSPVPEPAAASLVLCGIGFLALASRRRHPRRSPRKP